jgi:hypothetical protein
MGHKAIDCNSRREQQQRFDSQIVSNYFKKPGHYKAENQNVGNSTQRNDMASDTTDIALSAIISHESFKNIWIGDSFDQTTISEMITVGYEAL